MSFLKQCKIVGTQRNHSLMFLCALAFDILPELQLSRDPCVQAAGDYSCFRRPQHSLNLYRCRRRGCCRALYPALALSRVAAPNWPCSERARVVHLADVTLPAPPLSTLSHVWSVRARRQVKVLCQVLHHFNKHVLISTRAGKQTLSEVPRWQ